MFIFIHFLTINCYCWEFRKVEVTSICSLVLSKTLLANGGYVESVIW